MSSVQQQSSAAVDTRFGAAVSAGRQVRRLSQRDFAVLLTRLGMPVDASAVSRIEAGTRSVRLREAEVIAQALDMNLGALLLGDETTESQFRASLDRSAIALGTARRPIVNLMMWTQGLMEEARKEPALLDACRGSHPPKTWAEIPRWLIENYLPLRRGEVDASIGIDDFAQFNDEEEREALVGLMALLGSRLTEQGEAPEWLPPRAHPQAEPEASS